MSKTDTTENTTSHKLSFLQRNEVRLSTYHRIAGAFISGAGLTLLLPLILKDTIHNIFSFLSVFIGQDSLINKVSFGFICVIPLIILSIVAVKTIFELFKEIINFYYISNKLDLGKESRMNFFLPRLALTSLKYPQYDNSENENAHKQNTFLQDFVIPSNENNLEYQNIRQLIIETNGWIIPENFRTKDNYESPTKEDIYYACKGLANSVRYNIDDEVLKAEASSIRHNIFLRRLIFRYTKAFLLLITISIFVLLYSSLLETFKDVNATNLELLYFSFFISYFVLTLGAILLWVIIRPTSWLINSIKLQVLTKTTQSSELKKDEKGELVLTNPISEKSNDRVNIWKDKQLYHFETYVEKSVLLIFLFITLGYTIPLGNNVFKYFTNSNNYLFEDINLKLCAFVIGYILLVFSLYLFVIKSRVKANYEFETSDYYKLEKQRLQKHLKEIFSESLSSKKKILDTFKYFMGWK